MSEQSNRPVGDAGQPRRTETVEATTDARHATGAHTTTLAENGSSAPRRETVRGDDSARDSWLGTDRSRRTSNVSWGAIFAGVMTFLAVLVLLGVLATAMGLSAADGTAMGIWSLITLLLGLAAAGFVAGALAVRGGLLHGLVTWATSLVGLLLVAGLVSSSILGTVGGVIGGVANTAAQATTITAQDAQNAGNQVDPNAVNDAAAQAQNQVQNAAQDAANAFEQNRDDIARGAWWTFGGILLGGLVSSLAGVAGARAVHRKETELRTGTGRRVEA